MCWLTQFLVGTLFLACRGTPASSHGGEEAQELRGLSLTRTLILSSRGSLLMTSFNPNSFCNGRISERSHTGVRAPNIGIRGATTHP